VLIQEFCTDLLPPYLGFVQGVVDSEDLPLNVSRESVQSNRVMALLKAPGDRQGAGYAQSVGR
jgi:molecular chaperone HtpG